MKIYYALAALFISISIEVSAETIEINHYSEALPIPILQSVALGDTIGVSKNTDAMMFPLNIETLMYNENHNTINSPSIRILRSNFENRKFTKAKFTVADIEGMQLYIDGLEYKGGEVNLHPGTHSLYIKFVDNGENVTPRTYIETVSDDIIEVTEGKRMLCLEDILYGTRINSASVSSNGHYILINYSDTKDGGETDYYQKLYDINKGRFINTIIGNAKWLPKTERYVIERNDYQHGRQLITVDPSTGTEQIWATNIPDGFYIISPTEDFLIYSMVREGEKEDPEIYQVIVPDDRIPGWRDRTYPAIYKLDGTGILQTLAISNSSLSPIDISDDGSKLLLISNTQRLTKRPTDLFSIISLDINTLEADTIVYNDGFVSGAYFSPDAKSIVVTGTPEAFNRVGCTLPDNVIPSMSDNQLFIININDKSVRPLTKDFDPSVNSSFWNRYDNKIYLTATERDMYTLYSLNPTTCDVTRIDVGETVIKGADTSRNAQILTAWGQSHSNPDAIYTYNLKNGKCDIVDRPSESRLENVKIGECHEWTYENSRGDTVYASYYLPDNFDQNKKYPMIVNYYGGCSPSTRQFESRYPLQVYSSLGYVVLLLQPSGATGFGQEWSSRHVSTAGQGVAEDIIEGVKQFCNEKEYVNSEKIGCIGASYGGFMTQYLLTQTDIFAAGISHAGISDHTSYWGEGYWGYSYSQVSMGEDLPWTNPDLYVKQSPLYNADKIKTPLLFVHGDSDTNVPIGESIQMFAALKLLGNETALVEVAGQDHHIKADSKRKKWQDTIFAWFAKYLQDDPTWWNELYPDKNL